MQSLGLGRVDSCCRGEALELPEHYVPSAYREWDVHLFDWQSLCSTQVLGEEGLQYSLKRMMPTVGVSPFYLLKAPKCGMGCH